MIPNEYRELADFFVDQLGRRQQEMRVLFEALRDEIRLVAEGVLTNGRRIEENTRRMAEHSQRLDEHSQRLGEHGQRIDALSVRVGSLEGTVSGLFTDHETRLHVLERSKA